MAEKLTRRVFGDDPIDDYYDADEVDALIRSLWALVEESRSSGTRTETAFERCRACGTEVSSPLTGGFRMSLPFYHGDECWMSRLAARLPPKETK